MTSTLDDHTSEVLSVSLNCDDTAAASSGMDG